jgi:hypothetical protein
MLPVKPCNDQRHEPSRSKDNSGPPNQLARVSAEAMGRDDYLVLEEDEQGDRHDRSDE